MEDRLRIGVIGAGLTGLICADRLRNHGHQVTVFEKSRGLGGRIATRHSRTGLTFDHGAQFISPKTDAFKDFITNQVAAGAMAPWAPRHKETSNTPLTWFVGSPDMNSFLASLASGLDIQFDTRVAYVERTDATWHVHLEDGQNIGPFDRIVSAVPAPQAQEIFVSVENISARLGAVSVDPCWALLCNFQTAINTEFDVWRNPSAEIAWLARSSSKPARAEHDCWVLHATPSWSATNLEKDRDEIASLLFGFFRDVMAVTVPEPGYLVAHRWRYAQTATPLGTPFLSSDDETLLVGGDWALGARCEFAFESGAAMAAFLTNQ